MDSNNVNNYNNGNGYNNNGGNGGPNGSGNGGPGNNGQGPKKTKCASFSDCISNYIISDELFYEASHRRNRKRNFL